ncbi:hypothetical protein FOA52_014209 [Chlamydomonas sp. UWO 241]|nr:hypothetical protein FOA52_014209 [Chlamydomonas sp. UWO 241]
MPPPSSGALESFVALIRLVPLTRPEGWKSVRPLDVLHGYTTHAETTVRAAATEAIHTVMRSSPHLRNTLVLGYATHLASLPDDGSRELRDGMGMLRELLSTWQASLAGEVYSPYDARPCLALSVARLEGLGLSQLCSADEAVRVSALALIQQVRELHLQLAEVVCSLPPVTPPAPTESVADSLSRMAGIGGMGGADFPSPLPAPRQSPVPSLPPAPTFGGVGAGGGGGGQPGGYGALPPAGLARAVTGPHGGAAGTPTQQQTAPAGARPGGFVPPPPLNLLETSSSAPAAPDAPTTEPPLTYLIEVVEESGPDIVKECYWDFGDWSELWRDAPASAQPPPPSDSTPFSALLCARDEASRARLLRCLIQLARLAGRLCPASSACAQHELAARASRCLSRDAAGRPSLSQDLLQDPGGSRAEAWLYASALALALPPDASPHTRAGHSRPAPHSAFSSSSSLPTPSAQPPSGSVGSAMGPPPGSASSVGGGGGTSGAGPAASSRDLIRAHVALLHAAAAYAGLPAPPAGVALPSVSMQLSAAMALGHAHPDHCESVLDELAPLVDEAVRGPVLKKTPLLNSALSFLSDNDARAVATRGRADDVRKLTAHVIRIMAETMPSWALSVAPSLRPRLLEWVREMYHYLAPMKLSGDAFWEVSQVAYCLASVVRALAVPLLPQLHACPVPAAAATDNKPKQGHQQQQQGQQQGGQAGGTATNLRRGGGIGAAVARMGREAGGGGGGGGGGADGAEKDLRQSARCLAHAARAAMAELLAGPLFDADVRRPHGPVLTWIDRLFRSSGGGRTGGGGGSSTQLPGGSGVSKSEVAHTALLNLLSANVEVLFPVCLDRCYDKDATVSRGYFQAVCEVYSTQPVAVQCEPHILLSLILYKMVDPVAEVRDDALHLRHVLHARAWGPEPGRLHARLGPMRSLSYASRGNSPRPHHGLPSSPRHRMGASADAAPSLPLPLPPTLMAPPPPHHGAHASGAGGAHGAHSAHASGAHHHLPSHLYSHGQHASAGAADGERGLLPPGGPHRRRVSATGGGGEMPAPQLSAAAGGGGHWRTGSIAGGIDERANNALRESVVGPWNLESLVGDSMQNSDSTPLELVGRLQDTYQAFQMRVSAKYASEHPELSEAVVEEMMARQVECCDTVTQQPTLASLMPWVENLVLPIDWRGTWAERLLNLMYYVTLNHGRRAPEQIGALWSTLAGGVRPGAAMPTQQLRTQQQLSMTSSRPLASETNVRSALEFLLQLGMAAAQQDLAILEEYLEVAKRITLNLAHFSGALLTIKLLVTEIRAQMYEADPPESGSGPPESSWLLAFPHRLSGKLVSTPVPQQPAGTALHRSFTAPNRMRGSSDAGAPTVVSGGGGGPSIAAASGSHATAAAAAAQLRQQVQQGPQPAYGGGGGLRSGGNSGGGGGGATHAQQQQQQQGPHGGAPYGAHPGHAHHASASGTPPSQQGQQQGPHQQQHSAAHLQHGAQQGRASASSLHSLHASHDRALSDAPPGGRSTNASTEGLGGGRSTNASMEGLGGHGGGGGGSSYSGGGGGHGTPSGGGGAGHHGQPHPPLHLALSLPYFHDGHDHGCRHHRLSLHGPLGQAAGIASRAHLTRPDLALCLLTEVAFVHGRELIGGSLADDPTLATTTMVPSPKQQQQGGWRGGSASPQGGVGAMSSVAASAASAAGARGGVHPPLPPPLLPLLLHACLLSVDHGQQLVGWHAQQLLLHLLYTWSQAEANGAEQQGAEQVGGASAGGRTPAGGGSGARGGGGGAQPVATPTQHTANRRGGGGAATIPVGGDAAAAAASAALQTNGGASAAALAKYLLSISGARLWERDGDASPLARCASLLEASGLVALVEAGAQGGKASSVAVLEDVVAHTVDAFSGAASGQLSQAWTDASFAWALHARSRHLSCRSWQVYRALRPQLSPAHATTVLRTLHASFAAGGGDVTSAPHREAVLNAVESLRAQVGLLSPARLLLLPQLFWASLALLHSRSVEVYTVAVSLLSLLLAGLDLASPPVQSVLLAASPAGAGPLLQALPVRGGAPGTTANAAGPGGGIQRLPSALLGGGGGAGAARGGGGGGADGAPEAWELGSAVLLGVPPNSSGGDGGGGSSSSNNNTNVGRGGRYQAAAATGGGGSSGGCVSLCAQQLLLKGLLSCPPGSQPQLLSLRCIAQLAGALEHAGHDAWGGGNGARGHAHTLGSGGSCGGAGAGGGAGMAAGLLSGGMRTLAGAAHAVGDEGTVGGRPRAHGTSAVADRERGGGRPRAYGTSSDADGDAADAARLGASANLFASLKRHAALKADRARALLGPWRSQLAVSLLGVLPLVAVAAGARGDGGGPATAAAGGTGSVAYAGTVGGSGAGAYPVTSPSAAAAPPVPPSTSVPSSAGCDALSVQLSATLSALAGAASARHAHGLRDALHALSVGVRTRWAVQPRGRSGSGYHACAAASCSHAVAAAGSGGGVDACVSSVCAQLRALLFPDYSATFLHHCLDLLNTTASSASVAAAAAASAAAATPSATSTATAPATGAPAASSAPGVAAARGGGAGTAAAAAGRTAAATAAAVCVPAAGSSSVRLQAASLSLLRCMFEGAADDVRSGRAAPARGATALLASPSLLDPVTALLQDATLGGAAIGAVGALLAYASAAADGGDDGSSEGSGGATAAEASAAASASSAEAGSGGGGAPVAAPAARTLGLPRVDVAELLRQVVEAGGGGGDGGMLLPCLDLARE